ncbi:MAG: TerB family tellurite resistance protein, partial [Candidatus Binatia bacterium]
AEIARNKTVALRGAENHLLTRRFNERSSEEERLRLVDCLYAVATADDLVSHVEDREVRRIGAALMLPTTAVLEIRSRYRDRLEELQQLRKLHRE